MKKSTELTMDARYCPDRSKSHFSTFCSYPPQLSSCRDRSVHAWHPA